MGTPEILQVGPYAAWDETPLKEAHTVHRYHDGFGAARPKEPMFLGHEVAGRITALVEGVEGQSVGPLVAVSWSRLRRALASPPCAWAASLRKSVSAAAEPASDGDHREGTKFARVFPFPRGVCAAVELTLKG